MTNAVTYSLRRAVGTGASVERVTLGQADEKGARDIIPDPRDTYLYTLVVTYADGTWGTSQPVQYVSPPLKNPNGFTARDRGLGNVEFQWQAVSGAVRYRLDGPGMPGTGYFATATTTNFPKTPAGANSWKLTALYQGNFADYDNPSTTSAVVRILPPHTVKWLSKNNGAGSAATAQMPALYMPPCDIMYQADCIWETDPPSQLEHPYDSVRASALGRRPFNDFTFSYLQYWLGGRPALNPARMNLQLWDMYKADTLEALYGNGIDLGVVAALLLAQAAGEAAEPRERDRHLADHDI